MVVARLPLVMAVGLALDASVIDECGYFFSPPHGSAGAELYRLGKTAGATSLPPCAFADGDDGENLRQTEKAVSGDELMLL